MVRGALHRNVVVVHYHFRLQRLINHMGLVDIAEGLLLHRWALETGMHVINLPIGSNG